MRTRLVRLGIAVLNTALLSGCSPFYGWPNFPEERFRAYAPYEEGQLVMFLSEEGDTVTAKVTDVQYDFTQVTQRGITSYGQEAAILRTIVEIESMVIDVELSAYYRKDFEAFVGCHEQTVCDGLNMSYEDGVENIDEFETLLRETIELTGTMGTDESDKKECKCIMVIGRGVTSFTVGGDTWQLVE